MSRVTIRVERVWKGDANELLTFTTGTTCSYLVQPDERHLFFMGRAESGELTTGRCMGNSALNRRKKPDVLSWLQRRGAPGRVLATALGR
jgi:hypothetical protein